MEQNNESTLFNLEVDQPVSKELAGVVYWARLVVAVGYILQAILVYQALHQALKAIKPKGAYRSTTPKYMVALWVSEAIIIFTIWIANASLLLKFSKHMRRALLERTQVNYTIAFNSLKKSFIICFAGYVAELLFWAAIYGFKWFGPSTF